MVVTTRKTLAAAAGTTVLAAGLWFGLAWRAPTSTFHFAPLVAVVVGPYVGRSIAGRQPLAESLSIAAVSALVVVAAIVALVVGDRLQGPTFWSADGAALEAVLFTAAGAAIGVALLASGSLPTGD